MIRVWLLRSVKLRLRMLRNSTLLMNALYLMLSMFVVALTGFVFWVVIARSYAASIVGLATTLLSVSGLLSLLALAGFDTTFVRFLPTSKRQSDYMNSGLIIVLGISTALTIALALALPLISPRLSVLRHAWPFAGFVFFTVATTLNILTNAVFIAFKRMRLMLGINLLFSVLKVLLPCIWNRGSVMTIFVMVGTSQLVGLVLSLIVMRNQLGYVFSPRVHFDMVRMSQKYSLSVYTSSILNLLPPTLLPLLIVHQLGPENAAYYYMAFTIANVLYAISYASMQSAFAEGSHDQATMRQHVAKAAKLVGVLLLPAVLIMTLLSSFILRVFGGAYAARGSLLLQLFALSAVVVAAYSALGAIFKVTQNLRGVLAMNVAYASLILSSSYLLVPHFGVVAIGWAWMLGNMMAVGVGLIFLRHSDYVMT